MTASVRPQAVPRWVDAGNGITLRPPGPGDVAALVAAINADLDYLRAWMPWARDRVTEQTQGEFVTAATTAWDEGREFVYLMVRGDEVLGAIGLHRRRGPGVLEIGYWLRADQQGRGVVTAASRALVQIAWDAGAERVDICCDEANVRSAAVPRRLGFRLAAVEERTVEAPGETGRHQIWSLEGGEPPLHR